jgi:hypothetical protein
VVGRGRRGPALGWVRQRRWALMTLGMLAGAAVVPFVLGAVLCWLGRTVS